MVLSGVAGCSDFNTSVRRRCTLCLYDVGDGSKGGSTFGNSACSSCSEDDDERTKRNSGKTIVCCRFTYAPGCPWHCKLSAGVGSVGRKGNQWINDLKTGY